MLVIHAEFPVKREKTKDAKEAAERLVVGSRRESGVLEYLVTSDVEDENTPLFVERYEDGIFRCPLRERSTSRSLEALYLICSWANPWSRSSVYRVRKNWSSSR